MYDSLTLTSHVYIFRISINVVFAELVFPINYHKTLIHINSYINFCMQQIHAYLRISVQLITQLAQYK